MRIESLRLNPDGRQRAGFGVVGARAVVMEKAAQRASFDVQRRHRDGWGEDATAARRALNISRDARWRRRWNQ
jgi:hypothetical protein